MNKSIGLLKSIMKKTYINKRQTMEVNHSNRYSPSKRQKRQIISINKASKEDFNSNIEKKKIIYQQSIQKLDRNNKLKLSQNKKNMEINRYYKNNNILNGNNNIPNNFKNRLNNSKTINHHLKNKNYNTSLQKKIGSKSYVDLFQNNNIYNSNDHIMHGGGKTISNSIYEKIYDFENENFNFSNKANNNNENNSSNEYNNNTLAEEANNIINLLLNYIDIIKKEYEKIILEKMQNKDKEIIKLKRENEFLIKENKNLKFKILQIFYCAKKINSNKNNEESKSTYSIKQLLKENLFLRKCLIKSDNINEDYLVQLEKDIIQQFKYKELLNQKKILEEEKNNEENNTKLNNNKEENSINNSNNNNPFKFINENNNNNSNNNKINHKRQKTQYKLNFYSQNKKNNIDNNIDDEEFDKNENNEEDSLSNYLNEMNNNILMGKTKEGSQKNLIYINKNNKSINNANNINKDNNSTLSENINNNKSNNEQSFDSIVHNVNNNTDNKKENELIKENENDNNNINKKLFGMSSNSTFDKYSQRIEFTK